MGCCLNASNNIVNLKSFKNSQNFTDLNLSQRLNKLLSTVPVSNSIKNENIKQISLQNDLKNEKLFCNIGEQSFQSQRTRCGPIISKLNIKKGSSVSLAVVINK